MSGTGGRGSGPPKGAMGHMPENTVASSAGGSWEHTPSSDLRLTADGEVVVMHDAKVDRPPTGMVWWRRPPWLSSPPDAAAGSGSSTPACRFHRGSLDAPASGGPRRGAGDQGSPSRRGSWWRTVQMVLPRMGQPHCHHILPSSLPGLGAGTGTRSLPASLDMAPQTRWRRQTIRRQLGAVMPG